MRIVGKAYERAYAFRDATAKWYLERVDRPWAHQTSVPERDRMTIATPIDLTTTSIAKLVSQCDIDHSVGPVADTRGGSTAGYARWESFRRKGLELYERRRNQIEVDGVSRMSAYLHYGMVSPFRLAREASAAGAEKFSTNC